MLRNNFCYLKRFSSYFGICLPPLIFSLPTYSFSHKWECKEIKSYSIVGKSHVNAKNDLKKYPNLFLEDKELKTFSVTYDFKKKTGSINGSPVRVIVGDLEAKGEVKYHNETIENPDGEIIETKNFYSKKNTLVPITFFSSASNIEQQTKRETSFFKKSIMKEKQTLVEDKKYFTIEDANSSSDFSTLSISINDDSVFTIDSDDNESSTLDLEEVIDLSIGKCKLLEVKG